MSSEKIGNIFQFLQIYKNKNIKVFTQSSPIHKFSKNKFVKSLIISNINKEKTKLNIKKAWYFAGGLGNPNLIQNLFQSM